MTTAAKTKKCATCGKAGGSHTDYCPHHFTTTVIVPDTPLGAALADQAAAKGWDVKRQGDVDGEPAIIDGTVPKPEPLISRPTLEEAMAEVDSAEKIEREFNEKLEIAKSAYKIAKDRLERSESVALEAYRDRLQMALGEAS